MYSDIQFELVGHCNAKCKYCVTGQANLNNTSVYSAISYEEFVNAMAYLYQNQFINKDTYISLYNYGEPLLHKDLHRILTCLNEYGNPYEISTNASIYVAEQTIAQMKHLQIIKFSMCGFSQTSYDKISKLQFETVKQNIVHITTCLKKYNIDTECIIKFQGYQFNLQELSQAIHFAYDYGITIIPIHALYANLEQQLDFLKHRQAGQPRENGDELLWYYLNEMSSEEQDKFICPLKKRLVIDENLNVVQCCMITKSMPGYTKGNLFELTPTQLATTQDPLICDDCIQYGVAYAMTQTPSLKIGTLFEHYLQINKDKNIVLIGAGNLLKSLLLFINAKGIAYVLYPSLAEAVAAGYKDLTHCYFIIATRYYLSEVKFATDQNWYNYQDYFIYNTYLR